jgi:hypothetical protein
MATSELQNDNPLPNPADTSTPETAERLRESRELMELAWRTNMVKPLRRGRSNASTFVADARAAVQYMRDAAAVPQGDLQAKVDLVYLLDNLCGALEMCWVDDPALLAEALAVSLELVERQATIVADCWGTAPDIEVKSSLEMLQRVVEIRANIVTTAGASD